MKMWERLKQKLRKKPGPVPAGRGILGFLTTLEFLRIQQKAYLRRVQASDALREREMNRPRSFHNVTRIPGVLTVLELKQRYGLTDVINRLNPPNQENRGDG